MTIAEGDFVVGAVDLGSQQKELLRLAVQTESFKQVKEGFELKGKLLGTNSKADLRSLGLKSKAEVSLHLCLQDQCPQEGWDQHVHCNRWYRLDPLDPMLQAWEREILEKSENERAESLLTGPETPKLGLGGPPLFNGRESEVQRALEALEVELKRDSTGQKLKSVPIQKAEVHLQPGTTEVPKFPPEPPKDLLTKGLTFQQQIQLRALDVAKSSSSRGERTKKRKSHRGDRRIRRRSSSRSSSSSDSSDRGGKLLQETSTLRLLAEERPGALMESLLKQMRRYLADKRGPGGSGQSELLDHGGTAIAYLTTALEPSLRGEMGVRSARELRTLAEAVDSLAAGRILEAGDLLSQRFRAVEKAQADGHWNSAKHLELIPDASVTTVPEQMLDGAMRREMFKLKLREREQKLVRGPAQH